MRQLLALGVGLSPLALSQPALAQRMAGQTEYTPEEYTEKGQTNGCGMSFVTVWPADGGVQLLLRDGGNAGYLET
jgi:hypothetical protein